MGFVKKQNLIVERSPTKKSFRRLVKSLTCALISGFLATVDIEDGDEGGSMIDAGGIW